MYKTFFYSWPESITCAVRLAQACFSKDEFNFSIYQHKKALTKKKKPQKTQSFHHTAIRENLYHWVCFFFNTDERYGKQEYANVFICFPPVGNDFNWLIEDIYLIGCGLIIQNVICQAVQFSCNSVTVSSASILSPKVNALIFPSSKHRRDQSLKDLWRTLIEISGILIGSDRHNLGECSLAATWGAWQTVSAGHWAWLTLWC